MSAGHSTTDLAFSETYPSMHRSGLLLRSSRRRRRWTMTRRGRETTGMSWLLATAMALVMLPSLVTASKAPSQLQARTPSKLQAMESYGRLPLSFEANNGQTESQVRFLARGRGYTLFLSENEAVFALRSAEVESVESVGSIPGKEQSSHLRAELSERTKRTQPTKQAVLRMRLEGANRSPMAHGVAPLPGVVNYFIGNDPKKWRTHIPTYEKVEYKNIYPGIDVVYYGNQGKLEYDFIVSPGADPNQIKLAFEGAENPRLADNGDVTLTVSGADLYLKKPLVYQQDEKGRKQLVAGNNILLATDSPRAWDPLHSPEQRVPFTPHVAIQVASYDRSRPLVIDPVLAYSTHLGGSGGDQGFGVAVDAVGNAYVTGFAGSSDFPTTAGAFQTAFGGGEADAFVTKLNPTGSALVYTTYLGGDGFDQGHGIAVDATGNAYVTGLTFSTNFPTTPGAFQTTPNFASDAFVVKLNAAGTALVYSTYLGGDGFDQGQGIAVDAEGNAYATGGTSSTNFPTTTGAFRTTFGGRSDAFVTKLNGDGSALVYSTYLGGFSSDRGNAIAVDATGNAYVTGLTFSTNFPTTPGAVRETFGGILDAFMVKLNPAGTALVYSTFLGGSSLDEGFGIAVDTAGSAYVTGGTESPDFPTTPGAVQTGFGGTPDAFVAKLAEINTPAGGNVLVQPVDLATGTTPVTLTFSNVTGAGVTGLATSRTGPPPPAGFKPGSPPTYFDITTTAVSSASASVLVCINYTGITFSAFSSTAGLMRLMHFAGTGFVDVTTSLDTTAAVICGLVNSLSPFAIFEPSIQAQAFATFRPKVEIELSPGANNDSFEVEAFFTLGAGAGIAPLTEDLTLKVGPYSTTIPAGSFKQKKGRFKFRGVIDGVRLTAKIQPRARGGFKFEAEGKCAELTGTVNPVTVELTIGEDVGSATVKADISSRSEGRKCGDRRDDDKDDDDD